MEEGRNKNKVQKVHKLKNKMNEKGAILQDINKRGGGNLCEEG